MSAEVVLRGPIFDRGEAIVMEWAEDVAQAYGKDGLSEIGKLMNAAFKNPTPYYETQVMYEPLGAYGGVIHDRGIVYGPWLEGVGSRNATSRFKGYHHWRRTLQYLEENTSIMDRMLPDLMTRLT